MTITLHLIERSTLAAMLALGLAAACGGSRPAAAPPAPAPGGDPHGGPPAVVIPPDVITFHQDLAWSPDSTRIAFSLRRIPRARWEAVHHDALAGTEYDVYVVGADGRGMLQVTDDAHDELWLSWLPDGQQLAFASTRAGEAAIYVIGVADGDPEAKQVTAPVPRTADAAWSPTDGRSLAYSARVDAHTQLFIASITETAVRQLTRGPFDHRGPAWSPDGRALVFQGNPRGPGKEDIFVLTLEGGVVAAVTDDDANDIYPGWLPDGRVTFTTIDADGKKQVVARPIDRDNRIELVDGAFFARVSPDGRSIAYIAGGFPDTSIYVRPIDPAAEPVKIVE